MPLGTVIYLFSEGKGMTVSCFLKNVSCSSRKKVLITKSHQSTCLKFVVAAAAVTGCSRVASGCIYSGSSP